MTDPRPLTDDALIWKIDALAAASRETTADLINHLVELERRNLHVKRGLILVVEDARGSGTRRPRSRKARSIAADSREIPAHVQRAVWHRDGGQCAFVGRNGWRCEERCYLEYHHLKPWITGGMPSVENIALRCHAHNQYEAKVFFARGAQDWSVQTR